VKKDGIGERSSGRGVKKVRVRSAGGRKESSRRWLERQLNDPYVRAAKDKGYRSRAAFKLVELDQKYKLFRGGMRILDLGAAPGGWSQVAASRVGDKGKLVATDILEMEPIPGVDFLRADFLEADTPDRLIALLGGPADLVMSDMAAPTVGHRATDHLRTVALLEAGVELAEQVLAPGGTFIGKVFQGGATGDLLTRLKKHFRDVKHAKPPASRAESVEMYVVAKGFNKK
jgi:23S rRNA (uridine2552-2'-O)-methyltransferase